MSNKTPFDLFKTFNNDLSGYTKPEYKELSDWLEQENSIPFDAVSFQAYGLWSLIQYGNKQGKDSLSILVKAIQEGYLCVAHRDRNKGENSPKIKVMADTGIPTNPLQWIDNRKSRFQSLLLASMDISSRSILRSILTGKPVTITVTLDFSKGIEEKGIENLKESVSDHIKGIKDKREQVRRERKVIPMILKSGWLVEGMTIQNINEDAFTVVIDRNEARPLMSELTKNGWSFAGNTGEDDGFGSTTHILLKHILPEMKEVKVKSKR